MQTRVLAIGAIIAATAGSAPAQSPPQANPAWSACTANADCVTVPNRCGFLDGVNRAHVAAYSKFESERREAMKPLAPAVTCLDPATDPAKGGRAECVNGRCAAMRP